MAKRHPATEAGIIIRASYGYEKAFPPVQWRQAIRTGLAHYWSSGTGLGVMPTFVDVEFTQHYPDGKQAFVKFNFHPRDWHSQMSALLVTTTNLVAPGARLLDIGIYDGRDGVAAALARFSWCRWFQGLVVPVGWLNSHSIAIRNDRVTLWVTPRGLVIYNGSPLERG
jgi:hypothetical protein